MFVCILGRQPEISFAELEAVFGHDQVSLVTPDIAKVDSSQLDLSILGGTTKYGQVVATFKPATDEKANFINISRKIVQSYSEKWYNSKHKITLGISAYNFKISPRDVQKTGLLLKSALKKHDVSLRLIPNNDTALSTATSHNNKLGLSDNKVELLIIRTKNSIIIAESRGAQNITAYARRDRHRPRRDAFVGMLPPKLAQIMLNLTSQSSGLILDPFCGTGTVLQEALLRGQQVYGSDLNPKMIDYSRDNLEWLIENYRLSNSPKPKLETADACTHRWQNPSEITAIVCETYLGQPFSAPPKPEKLKEVTGNCNHIISQFLTNIHDQIGPGTPLCIAVPAWRDQNGHFTHLPLVRQLQKLGYQRQNQQNLIYHRPDQVVAREILVLKTA